MKRSMPSMKQQSGAFGGLLVVAVMLSFVPVSQASAGDVVSLQNKEPKASDIVNGLLGSGGTNRSANKGHSGKPQGVKTRGIVFGQTDDEAQPAAREKEVTNSARKAAAKMAVEQDESSTNEVSGGGCPAGNAVALSVPFEYNSYELSSGAYKTLQTVAEAMNNDKLANCRFAIEGHTDASGSPDYNMQLSAARAKSVRDFLASDIPVKRMAVVGKGKKELLNPNNPNGAENRRVQFRLIGEM
ncbi:MAG: OmpA family protein [Magnetococcales bacterium]|nr:OmpA family protein [Magnetococcales bacterium]